MIMDALNDSNDTIVLSNDEPSDSEIENILKKYTSPTSTICSNYHASKDEYSSDPSSKRDIIDECHDNYVVQSFDTEIVRPASDDIIHFEPREYYSPGKRKSWDLTEKPDEIQGKRNKKTLKKKKLQETKDGNKEDYAFDTVEAFSTEKTESKRKDKISKKTRNPQETKTTKVAKNAEKAKKKETMEKQKMFKNALKSVAKSTKPDECMKYIIVELDSEMAQDEYGVALKETFREKGICTRSKSQVLPNIVSWSRRLQTIEDMLLKESEVSENNFLLIMRLTEFSDHIKKNDLVVYLENIFSLLTCKQLTVVVVGSDKPTQPQDLAIIEAQMLTKTYFRFQKNAEGLADVLLEVTKAVAQIPYKLKKEETYKSHNEYFNDSNKDTVKIDKNGNGLSRLWHQMLTMFPLARLETAEAIAAVYPTPASLFQAYETCEKKEDLLQDINIRRAQGPLISSRRIGPELSKKCYNFFCSTTNQFL